MKKLTLIIFSLMFVVSASGCLKNNQVQNDNSQKQREIIPIEKSEKINTQTINCINDYKQQTKNNKSTYSKGRLIVTFNKGTTEQEAETIISAHGLSIAKLGSRFYENPWGSIIVPDGEEIEWACKISQDEKILSATLSFILSAH